MLLPAVVSEQRCGHEMGPNQRRAKQKKRAPTSAHRAPKQKQSHRTAPGPQIGTRSGTKQHAVRRPTRPRQRPEDNHKNPERRPHDHHTTREPHHNFTGTAAPILLECFTASGTKHDTKTTNTLVHTDFFRRLGPLTRERAGSGGGCPRSGLGGANRGSGELASGAPRGPPASRGGLPRPAVGL